MIELFKSLKWNLNLDRKELNSVSTKELSEKTSVQW